MAKNYKNNNNTYQNKRIRTPHRNELEMYGKVIQLMGVNNVKIMCEDGTERNCRIPGKMFKHIWIKPNDIVIIKLWDFQPSKADVVWRYLGFQKSRLERMNELNKLYEFTFDDIKPNNYNDNYNNSNNTNNINNTNNTNTNDDVDSKDNSVDNTSNEDNTNTDN